MLIKINRYRASQKQRVCEISKLIRYLLVGRGPGTSINRLAGPAFCRNLLQRHNPFDNSHLEFASDIAKQFELSVTRACFGEARPHDLCTHVIMSIPPRYRSRNPLSPSIKTQRVVNEGTYSGALEIALDVLDMLEVDHRLPLFCVVHCDRRHMHVHALLGRFASGAKPFSFNRSAAELIRISKEIDQRYELSRTITPRIPGLGSPVSPILARHSVAKGQGGPQTPFIC